MTTGAQSGIVVLSDVQAAPNAAGDTVVFWVDTGDSSVQLNFRIWDVTNPSVSASGTEASAKSGRRNFSYALAPLTSTPQGKTMGYEITSTTAPPPTLRPYQGVVRIPGARTVAKLNAVPVRWNSFGGTPPAPAGGTGGQGATGATGNWNQYTWAQYNPKGTTYPTP